MRRLLARLKQPLSLRTWMIAGIIGLVVIPWLGTFAVLIFLKLFDPSVWVSPPPAQEWADPAKREEVYRLVESQGGRWSDPDWCRQVEDDLARLNLRVILQPADGSSPLVLPDPWGPAGSSTLPQGGRPARERIVYADQRLIGKATWFANAHASRPGASLDELLAIYQAVESQPERWGDPQWRAELAARLAPLNLQVRLRDGDRNGRYEIPRQDPEDWPVVGVPPFARRISPDFVLERETVVYQGDSMVGAVSWYSVTHDFDLADERYNAMLNTVMPWVVVAMIIGTIWGAIHLASRALLTPLRSLSRASRQINAGDLDFTVPSSPVAEVNEFARAFDQMRQGIKDSIAHQAAMEQERRMFIAALAHDLRTPLSSVRGYLEGIRDGLARTPEKMERYVSVALEKTESLGRLIESLFAFAMTEYLEQGPQTERLELGDLLRTAAEAMAPRAGAKQVTIQLDEPGAPCWLEADRLMLVRVLDNLLDNAIRHTPPGGSVAVGWRGEPPGATFWVHDSGPGIPTEDLPHIFDPLYRGDKARSTRTGGAGLGLAIAQRLAAAHGGRITAANQNGARFTVSLPRETTST